MGQEKATKLDTIQVNNRSVTQCCSAMFRLWCQTQPKANWNQLIAALKEVDLGTLAGKLDNLLIPSDKQEEMQEPGKGSY